MDISMKSGEDRTVVSLCGRFVFECHRDFRAVVDRSLEAAPVEVDLDLGGVDYVDSAALGMLLVLGAKARKAHKTVTLCNSQGYVRDLLQLAHIDAEFAAAP